MDYYLLYVFVLTVISIEIHLLNFAHERVTGVGAGALVIESLLGHSVKTCEEVGFVGCVFADSLFDADAFFQFVDLCDESFNLLGSSLALDAEIVGNFGITLGCVRIAVLRECAHFGRYFG